MTKIFYICLKYKYTKDEKTLLLLLLAGIKIFGQEDFDHYLKSSQILSEGNYLGYLEYIENNKNKFETPEFLGDAYTFVGDYSHALKIYNNEHMIADLKAEKLKFDSKDYSYFTKKDKESILNEVKDVDFLLINEGHHRNFHRIFLRDNLKALYKLGFRNLFVEGVISFDKINERKFPIISTLTYPEPIYGEMIREAKSLGFNVISYDINEETPQIDDPIEDWNYRENIQFNNILKKFDGKKSIIYGGYSHTITQSTDLKYEFLGALLKKNHKVLSIDQTIFVEEHLKELEKEFYSENVNSTQPIFFKNDEKSSYDYTLIHPRTRLVDGKPNWLIDNKKQGWIKWSDINKVERKSVLVQVFELNEYEREGNKCIPLYQFVEKFNNGKEIPYFYYNKGNEILIIKNSENKVLIKKKL